MFDFGDALKAARIANGCTLRELAGNIGKSIGYLSDIERNRKQPPRLELVSKIEEFLEVDDGILVNLANKIRKNIKAEWIKTANLSRKLKEDQKFATIMYRAESLTDKGKEELIRNIEKIQEE